MEQFTAISQRCGLNVQLVPVVTKDIFVWTVGPRRSMNYLSVPSRNNPTYLLIYLLLNVKPSNFELTMQGQQLVAELEQSASVVRLISVE